MIIRKVNVGGLWRTIGRGPNGWTLPAGTGAYNRAATTSVSTTAALQTAINAASSDDVIEMTGNLETGTSASLTITGPAGAGSWANNVLVRPPLGTRLRMGKVINACPRLTVAGFDLRLASGADPEAAIAVRAPRAAFWRIVDVDVNTQWQIDAASSTVAGDGAGLYECVAPNPKFDNSNDRCQIKPDGTALGVLKAPVVDSCYIAPKIRATDVTEIQTNDHGQGLTDAGQKLVFSQAGALSTGLMSTTNVTTGVFSSKQWTPASGVTDIGTLFAWVRVPPTSGTVTIQPKKNGVNFGSALTLNGTPENQYNAIRNVDYSWAAGDSITVDVTSAGTGARDLTVQIGQNDAAHADTIQYIAAGGGVIRDPIIRNSVLDGCSNAALQSANMSGEWVIFNNWLGQSEEGFIVKLGITGSSIANSRQYVAFNHFNGSPFVGTPLPIVFQYNTALGYSAGSDGSAAFPVDATNASGVAKVARPACPDLASVWPDCPFSG